MLTRSAIVHVVEKPTANDENPNNESFAAESAEKQTWRRSHYATVKARIERRLTTQSSRTASLLASGPGGPETCQESRAVATQVSPCSLIWDRVAEVLLPHRAGTMHR